jgi:hypothetical protein
MTSNRSSTRGRREQRREHVQEGRPTPSRTFRDGRLPSPWSTHRRKPPMPSTQHVGGHEGRGCSAPWVAGPTERRRAAPAGRAMVETEMVCRNLTEAGRAGEDAEEGAGRARSRRRGSRPGSSSRERGGAALAGARPVAVVGCSRAHARLSARRCSTGAACCCRVATAGAAACCSWHAGCNPKY